MEALPAHPLAFPFDLGPQVKYPPKLKPVPGRMSLPGARPDPMVGPYSSMHMPPKALPTGPMLMGSASPLPMGLPKKPKVRANPL